MYTALQVITPPVAPLISVGLLRRHARVSHTADDELLQFYIDSATQQAQNYLNRALITQTITYHYAQTQPVTQWPLVNVPFVVYPLGLEWILGHQDMHNLDLIRSPVQSVTSIHAGQWGQTDFPLTQGTDFDVDLSLDPARVHIMNSFNWAGNNHVSITYIAGYGDTPDKVPSPIRHAVTLMASNFYENRGDVEFELIKPARHLLDDYRLQVFGSSF